MKAQQVQEYAQYIADRIDVTILLQHTEDISRDEAFEKAGLFLRDTGWQGRKYPLDYFTIATVDLP